MQEVLPPIASASGAIAGARGSSPLVAPPSESLHVHRERNSYGGLPFLLMPHPTMAPCFSCRSRPPPMFPWLWCSAPQHLDHHSLAPPGCLHNAIPRPLPGSDLWSLSFSALSLPKPLSLGCLGAVVPMVFAALSLLCPSPASMLLSEALRSLHLG